MKYMIRLLLGFLLPIISISAASNTLHVWEKRNSPLSLKIITTMPIRMSLCGWILLGPVSINGSMDFGTVGQMFHVRIVATETGTWTWKSGSNPDDPGLAGKSDSFHGECLE